MFNAVNVEDRLREFVRGRVIVGTTSKIVELVDKTLKNSYPLYSVDSIPDGYMLVFMVEVDGFLTFDPDSETRILPETTNFEKLHYDPTAFALVKAADKPKAFVYKIVEASQVDGSTLPFDLNADHSVRYFTIRVAVPPGTPAGQDTVQFAPTSQLFADAYVDKIRQYLGKPFDFTFQAYTAAGFKQYSASSDVS